jgi:hypothetical protein
VERNPLGFAVGWRRFRMSAVAQWALRWDGPEMRLRYSHGDVVTRLPPGAAGMGCSAHCGVEGMIIGTHILTFQAPPKSSPRSWPRRPMLLCDRCSSSSPKNPPGGGFLGVSAFPLPPPPTAPLRAAAPTPHAPAGGGQGHPEFSAADGSDCMLDIARARGLDLDPAGLREPDPDGPEILVRPLHMPACM